MGHMLNPGQSSLTAQSESLAHANFDVAERVTGEDHAAHAPGRICRACDRRIEPGQDARRRGEADWVHDVCPAVDG
jgi:hypothetical protein